ncbi:MAG: CotH kinase family protein [Bacteroidetes bacterium]|nr:CotH kinase family protein [Bacteroidota bacterium]
MTHDPLFIDITTDDFELSPLSPLRSQGMNGEDLGAIFPVGGIPVPQNELRLGHPQANMIYKGDSIIFIYWSAGNLIQNIDIDFSSDGGTTWSQLANNIPALNEAWQWSIPNIYSTKAFIRITDHNNSTKTSANILPFSILPVGDSTELPEISYQSGFYDSPIDVSITAPSGSIVYYTLDGSDPSDRSTVYSTPIHFDVDSVVGLQAVQDITASDFPTQPYSFIRSSPVVVGGPTISFWRRPNKTLMKAGVLRSRIYTPGEGLGKIVTSTFFIDPEIETKFTLPVISLVTDPENLFNYYTGIYIPGATFTGASFTGNYEVSGAKSERPASFEYFKQNGQQILSQEVGIRTRGEWIRNYGQKALTVFARSEYDTENNFEYGFFKGLKKPGTQQSLNEFKRIILRNNGNEWAIPGNSMCRDAMIQSLFDHMHLKYQAYTPAVAFLNGEYWGIHNIRELNDAWGLQKNYDVHRDSVILMENNLEGPYKLVSGQPGDEQKFLQLRDFIRQYDMSVKENYDLVEQQLDIPNFLDFWSATVYSNKKNTDHNQIYWKLRNGQPIQGMREGLDGRWRFIANDFDGGFYEPDFDNLDFQIVNMQDSIFRRLLTNPGFKKQFILRHLDLLNSSFETQRVLDRIDEIASVIEPEMPNHIGRWQSPNNMVKWYDNIEELRIFARDRNNFQRIHLANQFGLGALHELTVDVDDLAHGNIQVNTLFVSQDLPGVSSTIYPWKGKYFEGVNVSLTAIAKPGYRFVRWKEIESNETTITFNLDSDQKYTALFTRDLSTLLEELHVFPNPATEGTVFLPDYYKVTLLDITGKVVINEQTVNHLDVSQLQSGMYYLRNEVGMMGKIVVVNE